VRQSIHVCMRTELQPLAGVVCWLLSCIGCNAAPDSSPRPRIAGTSSESVASGPSDLDGPPPSRPAAELPATCLLAGTDAVDRETNFTWIAYMYLMAVGDDCKTRRLASGMTVDQTLDWGNYLINYTSALFGCGVLFDPLPGGVDAFALVNTEVVGVPNTMLGADDAATVIGMYLAAGSTQLDVSVVALDLLRARLEQSAARRIDPSLTMALSECAGSEL
jgi:hypothetical protein